MTPEVLGLVKAAADGHRIERAFLAAIVQVESAGNPAGARYEPSAVRYVDMDDVLRLAVYAGVTEMEEVRGQMTSWGLMQLMGYNARFLGYRESLQGLTVLPAKGLDLGCQWLKHLQVMYKVPVPDGGVLCFSEALACAYNAGHPGRLPDGRWIVQGYVDKVRAAYEPLRAGGL